MSRRLRTAGFTLLELLAAMALLATLGTFLIQLLRNGFDMYRKGEQRGDVALNAVQIIERLEDDLLAVHSGPEGRLVLQTDVLTGGKGRGDGFLLRLVRSIPGGERNHPVLRRAGTSVVGESGGHDYDGSDPGPDGRAEIAPPSGLLEVAYALVAEPADEVDRPGILTLYRGVRAPALDGKGFFASGEGTAFDEAWVRKHLKPIATDILGLWVLCFGQRTEDWGEELVLETNAPPGQSLVNWDSTRGLLPREVFPLSRGGASADDPRDDIYPREIRILLHLARGGRPDARLRGALRPDDTILRVNGDNLFPTMDDEDRYVKVGSEWLWLVEGSGGDYKVKRRGRRTTSVQTSVGPGTPAYSGRLVRRTLAMPARRSFWVEERR